MNVLLGLLGMLCMLIMIWLSRDRSSQSHDSWVRGPSPLEEQRLREERRDFVRTVKQRRRDLWYQER